MFLLRALLATLLLTPLAVAREHVSFPTEDGGVVYADLWGKGERGVVLAHGGRFNKESWEKQALEISKAGFRVMAIDFRGYGQSHGPQSKSGYDGVEYDVLAAVRYLHKTGARTVSVIGASFGGAAAAATILTASAKKHMPAAVIERLYMHPPKSDNTRR